jgi:hypothetical protein
MHHARQVPEHKEALLLIKAREVGLHLAGKGVKQACLLPSALRGLDELVKCCGLVRSLLE